jgi:hypothetical protein
MAKPICIITATGMICSASRMKAHHPAGSDCEPVGRSKLLLDRSELVRKALEGEGLGLPKTKQDVIATIVDLILAAKVGKDACFTIVRAG